jgi:hypothetical protein
MSFYIIKTIATTLQSSAAAVVVVIVVVVADQALCVLLSQAPAMLFLIERPGILLN